MPKPTLPVFGPPRVGPLGVCIMLFKNQRLKVRFGKCYCHLFLYKKLIQELQVEISDKTRTQ